MGMTERLTFKVIFSGNQVLNTNFFFKALVIFLQKLKSKTAGMKKFKRDTDQPEGRSKKVKK